MMTFNLVFSASCFLNEQTIHLPVSVPDMRSQEFILHEIFFHVLNILALKTALHMHEYSWCTTRMKSNTFILSKGEVRQVNDIYCLLTFPQEFMLHEIFFHIITYDSSTIEGLILVPPCANYILF